MTSSSTAHGGIGKVRAALDVFVAHRFAAAGGFLIVYYLQLNLHSIESPGLLRAGLLILLAVALVAAAAANYLWIPDYGERILGGVDHLRRNDRRVVVPEDQGLEQVRWANAQIVALVAIILAILAQFGQLKAIPPDHQVPALAVVLLILISLFDAALDLEAEWTICMLCAIAAHHSQGEKSASLASAVWHTNQHKRLQKLIYSHVAEGEPPELTEMPFQSFTNAAQNLVSFAIILNVGICAVMAWRLVDQLRSVL